MFFFAGISIGFAQNPNAKRIKITNPTKAELLKVKQAGIDLSCGAVFTNNSLILELGEDELQLIENKGISYIVLINDLISHYKNKSQVELPIAKSQLQAKKLQKTATKSLSTKSESVDNFIQYEGCSEVNWDVPNNFNLGSMGGCLTYSEVLAELDQMRSLYPNLISVKANASPTNQVTYGNSFTNGGQYDSWSGSTIYYVRISDNPDIDEPNEPESLYSGMTHSREVSSMMNLIYYMWYVLENYSTDPGIKNLVDNHEMYFVPVANPDGLRWNEQIAPNGGGMQRKNLGPYNTGNNNVRGVDLNRNYNYFWGSNPIYGGSSGTQSSNIYRGPSAFSEPETQIIRDFSAARDFKTAVNHHANSNLIPHAYNGYPNAPASGREAEYHKFCHDMTRFNRYIYGEAPDILTIANGDMSDWMLGGVADVNGSSGSGKGILALAPENGSWRSSDGEGGFWPSATKIVEIAQRAVRMNFVNAYHSGKFAQFHDLNTSNITATSGSFEFGLEYLGQTLGDITLNITPVSSNITSITPPTTQTGWSKLEQRTVTAAYTLDANIQPNDEIEFQITLSNDDGYVMYRANIIKLYNPSLLFSDNPDVNNLSNWTTSGGTWGVTSDAYSGSAAITDSPSGAYGNNQTKALTLNSSVNLSSASATVVQFYAKWDLERNFDYVQIQGSTNGSTWLPLCGKYTKPGSSISTNRYSSGNSSNTSTGKSTSDQNNQPSGESIYDSNTMNKWVMEEILIDASENSFLLGATNVQFRFVFDSDNTNRADGYPTTFDGFTFDDFRVISIETPCVVSVPTGLVSNNITETEATITWDNIISATYNLRYRVVGAQNWTNINDLTTPTSTLTGLANLTDYEVQVRSNCGTNNSAYTASVNFTTLDVQLNYCASAGRNVNDEFISRVELNTINNASGGQFYSDFTNISTTLTKDEQYSITITPTWTGTVYNEAYSVWIDYNRDGDFLDAGEQVFTQGNTQATSVNGSFTIPSTAVENSTRMRVSMKYNAIPTSCESFQYGEVEDYTVIIESSGPDIVAPVITLNGASTLDLNVGDVYVEQGATATDDLDGDITSNIVISGDVVNTGTGGTYVVTYDVNDAAGNAAAQVTRTVNVIPDTTAPVILLNGASIVDLNVGDAYTEEGAIASDNIDGNITSSIIIGGDIVDTNLGGTYLVTYDVNDAAGNPATQVVRTVNVIPDTTAPVITLNGATAIDLNVGDVYVEQGATAVDDLDGDITANIIIGGDAVNTGTGGTYTVTYNVNDAAGNPAIEITRIVNVIPDTTVPVITLNGALVIDISVGGSYTELGAIATDNIDGDITSSIVIGGDLVNTNLGGSYLVTYDVNDAAGNPAIQVVRTVNVIPDTTAPVIMLNGSSIIDLNVGDVYAEQGATAVDDLDGDITANIIVGGDVVNTSIGGTYIVTYNISDAAGNTAPQIVRTVNVITDITVPVITLIGSPSLDLNLGDTYNELGATASDDIDGDISSNIIIGGDIVNTNNVGTYNVTYNVSDNAGNTAIEVVRTINVLPDTTAPIITLNGAAFINLNVGDTYVEQGATALDNLDGDITTNIVITDNVNTLIAGTYFVDYNVSDSSGNLANTVTRTVNVIADTVVPTMALNGAATINLNVGDIYNEEGATASDNIDGDITANIVIGGDVVNTSLAGTYTVTYNVNDAAGNAATPLNRTVIVSPIVIGCSGGIADFPYAEGFENTLGGWIQSSSDDLNWLIDANGTPSGNTGPSSATQGSFYLYVEASVNGTGYPNKRAILTSPCFDLSGLTQATFSFKYHMFGASDMGTIALEISDDEGATWTSIWNESGNKGNSWQTANINLSTYVGRGVQLRFNRFVGSTWQADIAIDDVSLIDEEITIESCSGGITAYPYTESYENTLGGWTQSTADDINWTVDANGTPSSGTGPSSAITGSYYIYVEASGNGAGYPNKRAIINSPCYDLTSAVSPIFSFNYHMYGSSNMGTIALEASNDNGLSWTPLWSESGNKGNSWQSAAIDLSAYAGNSVQLRFNRLTGGTWQADIAIDNISLDAGSAAAKSNANDKFNTDLNTLTLYPNPVQDILNLKTLKGGEVSYRIINSLGQIVNEGKAGDRIIVDRLEAGMYFIEVTQGKDKMMKRFIKE